ncbi:DUF262 domain-containing protein [Photobacterium swingsii]|uniref:DUF262 domain-containing protein n=1 Tax=Photobacterium swingsii TaxID=680026 RepID=UPI0040695377
MKLIEAIDVQPQDVKWLRDLDHKGLLTVDNSFQRNYVWTKKNQVQLIESILMGFPVPEIYLWKTGTDEDTGDTKYSIVDGQQRCGAIFQYISNQFKLNAGYLNDSYECFDRIKGTNFRDLEADDKKAIWSYVFSVRLIRNSVQRSDIVNMFLRLNSNNLTLNPQELRNAEFDGAFIETIGELAELEIWDKYSLFGLSDRRRMRDVSFISTLLVFMKQGLQEDITNDNLNRIYDLYNDEYPSKSDDIERFKQVLNSIELMLDNSIERASILKRQVHLYTLFTVVYEFTLDQELSMQQIENYRSFIDNYDSEENLTRYFPEMVSDLFSYKALSKEGTRQKSNRIERHRIIKEIMNKAP